MFAHAALAASGDIDGWHEAKWGMTPDEVQKAVARPMFFADLAKVCDKPCDEGAVLELNDYDLNDQPFVVRLWFTKEDSRLHIVSMYAKRMDADGGNQSFSKMKSFLESTYGAPRSTSIKRGFFTIAWVWPSTIISLYSNATDQMTIVYAQRVDSETEKQ